MEESPCNLLSVKIIQIKNLQKADLFHQSSCYVSLFLPTASFQKFQTQAIKDCKHPQWNETFCFRIQPCVKNVLEMTVHDDSNYFKAGHLLTVLFDVSKIQLGEIICLTFPLDPKIQEELDVEFRLESLPIPPERIVTNGVLVSPEISCLEVQMSERKTKKKSTDRNLIFTVPGSYEETQNRSLASGLHPANPVVFHYIKYKESALEIESKSCAAGSNACSPPPPKPPPMSLPPSGLGSHGAAEQSTSAELALDNVMKLTVNVKDWPNDLDVRLGYDLCVEEQMFIQKRKKIVAAALKKCLHLETDLQEPEVPVVAIMATGGGARAFTALHGHLFALQKQNLLDCFTYITGSSGSTWTLSNLYENANWSHQELSREIAEARKNVIKCKLSLLSLKNLEEYSRALEQRQKEGLKTFVTDIWGLFIDKAFGSGKCNSTLSGQKRALTQGQNPLPIYMVLNTRDKYSLEEFKEWMEFTPFETGVIKYGAYIRSEDFGSKFFMGRMMKKIPESKICFMKGIWSNVFSYNLLDSSHACDTCGENIWHKRTWDSVTDIEANPLQPPRPHELNTRLIVPDCKSTQLLRKVITERITTSKIYNFLKGFQLHNGYLDNKNFALWKDTVLATFPNELTATSENLSLTDTAAYIDTSYPPLMRPERKVDVILHLNYSTGSQTAPLEEASRYFLKQGIPFPRIDLSNLKERDLKECYVFEDAKSSRAPIVVFFPLVNDTFRKYKAPGVQRSPSEMKYGEVDVTGPHSPYAIQHLQYTAENFDKLVELTSYNIQNNKYLILQALQRATERKKWQKR
ncbi:cytosolic phospholipase A2 epsilon-like [Tiliqua scincoides]|uniref:cytosolic phospholipase A2 epsilon-like n=1 Tax=Tiliqua scincoides TaxID=71010 RepID=UPI0034634FBF